MPNQEEGQLIGKISHYFSKIGVAIIDLSDSLKLGDTIRVVGGEINFTQAVESMQAEHQNIEEAKAGDSIGIKINQKVKEDYKVYKV